MTVEELWVQCSCARAAIILPQRYPHARVSDGPEYLLCLSEAHGAPLQEAQRAPVAAAQLALPRFAVEFPGRVEVLAEAALQHETEVVGELVVLQYVLAVQRFLWLAAALAAVPEREAQVLAQ